MMPKISLPPPETHTNKLQIEIKGAQTQKKVVC